MEKENKYLVSFLHLPKTGGTTLRNILRTQYLPEEILDLPSTNDFIDGRILQKNKKIKCIWAHVHLGIYLEIPFPKKIFTMLRDPIDRIISFYYYWLNCGLTSKSLEEFVNSNEPQLFNLQTTFISGQPLGIEPDLEVAKKNLTEKIFTFGIMENFNESLFLLKKDFGWNNLNYEIANVTPNRPNKKQLPSKIIDAIKEKNELDIKLYTYAKKTFKDRINLLDSHTQQELRDFIKNS